MSKQFEIPEHAKELLGLHLIERKELLRKINYIDHVLYKAEQDRLQAVQELYEFDADFRAKFNEDESVDQVILGHYMDELFRFMKVDTD
jgi:glycerol-3-phosphate cytidylyltransferase-like family protein